MEEVQGLEETVRRLGGFGSTRVKRLNDIEVKKEMEVKNDRTDEKNDEDKNETLKGDLVMVSKGLIEAEKRLKQHLGCPVRDRSFPSSN